MSVKNNQKKYKKEYGSLAEFLSSERQKLGFSQESFANICALDLSQIQAIEGGFELFLATTVRQKLATALKVDNKIIKQYEKKVNYDLVQGDSEDEANESSEGIMERIKEEILLNSSNPNYEIKCPNCGEKLITRIAKLYDLEDNLVLHPKARCSKCPFILK